MQALLPSAPPENWKHLRHISTVPPLLYNSINHEEERENPCGVCGHYHKYEEGEVCGVCGHRMPTITDKYAAASGHVSAFPSEILPDFIYLGSYDNASRAELLRTQRISHILNTVPACQNLYKNSFTYYCLEDDPNCRSMMLSSF